MPQFCSSYVASGHLPTPCRTSFFSLNDSKRPFHGVATFCKDATAAPVAAEDGLAGTRLQAAASAGRGICLEPDSTWWWRCADLAHQSFWLRPSLSLTN